MYKGNRSIPQEYIPYQQVTSGQILEETVADGLVDVDSIIDTNDDGYGYVKLDGEYSQDNGAKRRYTMKSRPRATVYYCKECDKCFKHPSKIQEHMRKHNGEKPYACRTCGARFSQGHVLKAHLRSHQGERPFKCSYCERCFATVAHRNTHEKVVFCPSALIKCIQHAHSENYQASRRDQPTTSSASGHEEHDDGLIYICPFSELCTFQASRRKLEEHINMVHDYEVNIQEGLIEDIWTEYQPQQEVIDHGALDGYAVYMGEDIQDEQVAENNTSRNLSQGQRLLEEEVPPPIQEIEVETTIPKYEIQEKKIPENMVVAQYENEPYEDHNLIFGADVFDGTIQIPVDPHPPKRGKPQIPKLNSENQQVIVEMDLRTIEMINPKVPALPKPPKRRTKQARNLDWIIDAVSKGHDVALSSPHNRKKPQIHTCEVCGKVDKYPSKIMAHMRTHTGEKPFACEICGMKFAQRTPMRLHMRRHLNARPFPCHVPTCEERFVSGALRNQHFSKKHLKEKKYVCLKGCGRYFASAKNQRYHEDKCAYNRDLDEDPVYQQLIYEQNQIVDNYVNEDSEANEEANAETWNEDEEQFGEYIETPTEA